MYHTTYRLLRNSMPYEDRDSILICLFRGLGIFETHAVASVRHVKAKRASPGRDQPFGTNDISVAPAYQLFQKQ